MSWKLKSKVGMPISVRPQVHERKRSIGYNSSSSIRGHGCADIKAKNEIDVETQWVNYVHVDFCSLNHDVIPTLL